MPSKDILRKVSDALGKKASEKTEEKESLERERRDVVTGSSKMIADALMPYLKEIADGSRITKEELKAALSEVQINVPESQVNIPEIRVPEAKVTVSMPEIKLPTFNVPPSNVQYPDMMRVQMDGVDKMKPLPVIMMDTKGNPFQFSVGGGSIGGKTDHFTVKGITQTVGMVAINPDGSPAGAGSVASSVSVSDIFSTVGANVVNPDGRIKVELPTGSSGITDTEIRATALPVSQLSGAAWSTSVTDIFGSVATNVVNPDGRLKVELPSGASGLTDTELRATSLTVNQLSGASWSTSVFDVFATTVTSTVVNADNRVKVELPAQTVTVSGITATIATANVDSTGVQYSGSNPLPVTIVTQPLASTIAVGSVVADAVDDGSAPVQGGGIARTANPTAVAGNDVVKATYDDLGRQVMRPLQKRDLIQSAYVSVANGTETTLLAASAGSFHDMIMVVGSNASDAAVSVDIRAVTGGNIINTLRIPANGTAGWTPPVPWPQDATGNNWTVDGPDETGRTLTFSALFSREI